MVACGALGMLAADGIESALAGEGDLLLAAGGNGVALGLLAPGRCCKAGELRADPDEDVDVIGAAVVRGRADHAAAGRGLRQRLRRPRRRRGRRRLRPRRGSGAASAPSERQPTA